MPGVGEASIVGAKVGREVGGGFGVDSIVAGAGGDAPLHELHKMRIKSIRAMYFCAFSF